MRASPSAAAALLLGYVYSAHAEEIAIGDALDVVQSGQCVDKDSLVAQVTTWLGHPTVDSRVHINVIASEGEMDATFVVQRSKATIGERRIRSAHMSCPEFRAALGLAIAAAIDAEIVGEEKKQAGTAVTNVASVVPDPAPPPTPAPTPAIVTREAPPRPPPPPSGFRMALAADAFFAAGLLTEGSAGVAPAAVVRVTPWLDTRFGAVVATSIASTQIQNGNVTQTMVLGTLEGCIVQAVSFVDFRGCPGLWLGNLSATGTGFSRSFSSNAFYDALAVRFDARFPKDGPIAALIGFAPVVPLGRWSVAKMGGYAGSETRDLPPVAIAGTIGVQMRIF